VRHPLVSWDQRYVWHPFTQQAEWKRRTPIIIESARGVWLKTTDGRKLLDGNSSLWVNVWGHRKPELDRALKAQIDKIAHSTFLGLTHEPAIRLARELIAIAPSGLARVFYSDNGSTAVEVALKMAYQFWQLSGRKKKTRFVSLKEGYHGDTLGAVSVGGVDLFHQRFRDLLFKGWQASLPDAASSALRAPSPSREKANSLSGKGEGWGKAESFGDIERLITRHHSRIAAVILEPLIQGASGMRVMPRGYLKHVETVCRRHNVLLIVDEVATGFGRTGTMFAVEQENVQPDFLCVAKSLTGGYLPLAATLSTERIFRAFLGRYDEFKTFFHGHTYTANPLACAVALENLRLYKKEKLIMRLQPRIRQLCQGLAKLAQHPHVKEVRQIGLMAGIELVADKATGQPYKPAQRLGLRVCDAALERGLWLRPLGDTVVLMPPLGISKIEMDFLLRGVQSAIQYAT